MPAINVARTDTFEVQRQKINQIGDQIFNISQGGSDLATGNLKIGDGSISSPSLAFISDSILGIYKPEENTLGFISGGNKVLDISKSSNISFKDIFVRQNILNSSGLSLSNSGKNYDPGVYNDVSLFGGSGSGAVADLIVEEFTGSITNFGSNYTEGSFVSIPLNGGSGSGAFVEFTVEGIDVNITSSGSGYVPGTFTNVSLDGGSGSGAVATIDVIGDFTFTGTISSPGTGYSQGSYTNVELLNQATQSFSVTTTTNPGTPPPNDVYVIDGNTQQQLTIEKGNTYLFDISDISNSGHLFDIINTDDSQLDTNYFYFTKKGTDGSAGSFAYLVVKLDAPSTTLKYVCNIHENMGANINVIDNQGTIGVYGTDATADIDVDVTGAVSLVSFTSYGVDYNTGDILTVYNQDVGGSGSNFNYTLSNVNYTGTIDSVVVTDNGLNYANGDTLTVNNSFNGGFGSGASFTINSSPGIINTVTFSSKGSNYQENDILSLPEEVSGLTTTLKSEVVNVSTTLDSLSPIISVADTTGIIAGMSVENSGDSTGFISDGTIVQSVDSATQITLSQNPDSSGDAILRFFSTGNLQEITVSSVENILINSTVLQTSGSGQIANGTTVISIDSQNNILTISSVPDVAGSATLTFVPPYGSTNDKFSFTVDKIGNISSYTITDGGIGYSQFDKIGVDASDLTQPITYPVITKNLQEITFVNTYLDTVFSVGELIKKKDGSVESVTIFSGSTILLEALQSYNSVAAIGGSGSGVTFDVTRDPDGAPSVSINQSGYFYQNGETVTIPGNQVGGSSPSDDIVVTIDSVSTSNELEIYEIKSLGGNLVSLIVDYDIISSGEFLVKSSDTSTEYEVNDVSGIQYRFFIDVGSGYQISPNLTLYSGNIYIFDLSDSSNSGIDFSFSEFKDGSNSVDSIKNISTVLSTLSDQISVPSTSDIVVGMNVEVVSGEGQLLEETRVEEIIDGTTIKLSISPLVSGNSVVSFFGYEYTNGVTRNQDSLQLKVSDLTPQLYYFSSTYPDVGGQDDLESIIQIDTNNPKQFGQDFELVALSIDSTDIITASVVDGSFNCSSLTSQSASISNLSATSVSSTAANITSLTTNQIFSSNLSINSSTTINGNLDVGQLFSVDSLTGNLLTSGELKTTDSLNINDILIIENNDIRSSFGNNLVLSPPSGNVLKVNSTTALTIPSGTTSERPTNVIVEDGSIRFNTETNQYEGYSSANSSWSSLGGVRDLDGNTTILAEESVGSNDNTLWFINDNINTIRFTPQYQEFVNVKKIRSVNTSAPDYTDWTANTPVNTGVYLKYRNNIFEVVTGGTTATSGSEPTDTSGNPFSNGTTTLRYFTTAVAQLTFEEISQLNIDPLGFTDLVVNGELRLSNNTISTDSNDLVIQPNSGKKVSVNSNTSLVIPVGDNNSRGNAARGSIRFNTSILQYEGYDGSNWSSLGGVRDVDGNTYIIPETSPGSNENILYFYNNNSNTLRVTENQVEFDTIDTIVSGTSDSLNINAGTITFDSLAATLDNTSATETFLFSTKDNLDFGLSSGLNTDHLLRLTNTGNVIFNLGFGTGTDENITLLNSTLTSYNLKNVRLSTSRIVLKRGTNNSGNANVYNTSTENSAKLLVTAHNITTGDKELIEFLVTHDGTDVFFTDTSNIKTGVELISTTFDISPTNNVRITVISNPSLTVGDEIEITIVNTTTKR